MLLEMSATAKLRAEDGFTILEVLVAAIVLVIGLAGTLAMLDQASATTTSNKAREGGVTLQRELVESARSIPYDRLTPASLVADITATPGFAGSSTTSRGWSIVRRGITYSFTVGACTVDDPGDGIGSHDPAIFCASGAGATSAATCRLALGADGSVSGAGTASGATVGDCGIDLNRDGLVDNLTESQAGVASPAPSATPDRNPDDYKRVVTLVRWDRGSGMRYALQSTVVAYPGLSGAPKIASLTATSPPAISFPLTITDQSRTSIDFRATTARKASSLGWYVDGTPFGTATDTGGGMNWSFAWSLGTVDPSAAAPSQGERLDGPYQVSAQAFDRYGQAGPQRSVQVNLNRRIAFAPTGVVSARIENRVELTWRRSPERDIQGYEVFRTALDGSQTRICGLTRDRLCQDASPPFASGSGTYVVYAFDLAPDGTLRRGQGKQTTLSFLIPVPGAPGNLSLSRSGSSVTLSWTPSATIGVIYQVYRDGTTLADRYGQAVSGTTFTDSDASGSHTYYVAARIDSTESAKTAGVTG